MSLVMAIRCTNGKGFALLLIVGGRGPAVSKSRYGVGSGPVHTIARRSYPTPTAWAYRRISLEMHLR